MDSISTRIATELGVHPQQVTATIALLDEGATVPFIARYRKEITGSLDDTQLRNLEERLRYLRELDDRRASILASIDEQGKLTPELQHAIEQADTKTRLEDLYLPYKKKRRTKGQIALEAGLGELADLLFNDANHDPHVEAARFIDAENGFADEKAVLEGAKYILMERFAEDAALLERLRNMLQRDALLTARVVKGKEQDGAKFSDYFEHDERFRNVPSHRALAIFRGRNEGFLTASLSLGEETAGSMHPCEVVIAEHFSIKNTGRPADAWLAEVVRWTWRVKLSSHLETDLFGQLREASETEAINVFARNLHDLLLAAPAGPRCTLGIDPGLRTGCKIAVVDATGKVLDTATVYPHVPHNKWDASLTTLAQLCKKHQVQLIAIGNGTGSRESDRLAIELVKLLPELRMSKVMVSEAGASVYSASALAAQEFPDLDVSLRGAVSIARRLQDPLAELVKIDPKAIGVGQYQHDVSQTQLARSLDAVVEDCVNAVGVDVNTASDALLARISGLNSTLAKNIVAFRDEHGAFSSRAALKKVPRLGEKTFELAAGFLRVMNGKNPLDASAVHPETYPLVTRIAQDTQRDIRSLIGDSAFLKQLDPKRFTDDTYGLPTVTDILQELDKPARDPRPEFKTAAFQDGVESLKDLTLGMVLEGVITNVTNFGAFVDIGVHQDGLVHISALSESFVKDPYQVVKAGDIVKVKVMDVDIPRARIALSMRMSDNPGEKPAPAARAPQARNTPRSERHAQQDKPAPNNSAMAALFAEAKKLKKK
ncbi:RNA-binding transcriptional accessory protein [Pseudomonas sp. C27(2019)]|uniref:Tex family protein n=1 Tax=Pseudomonas sp. C27(2019) TaxID=2604941 RepID=UPI0012471733|nr:Tex family protein [Pseudomonas sp. C27(2019)]QEY57711.1 RNA-binding transcriptional accessory protein [Pseudomonas sp. C27(2019)]